MRDKIVANSRPPPPPPSKQQRGKPSQNDQNTRSPRGRFGYQRDRPSRYSFQGQNSSEEKNPFDSHGPAQQRPNWQKLGSQHTRQNFEKFSHIEPRRVYEKHPSRREENPFLTPGPPSKIQPEQKKPVSYQINAAGDWNCPTCAAEVLSYKEQCPHCKTERPEEVRPEEPKNDSKLRNLGRSVLSEMDQDWEADTDRDQHHTKETESASGDARKEPKKDPSSWDMSVLDNLESFEMADPDPVEPVKQAKNRVERKGRDSNFEDDGFDEAARERSRQHRKAQQKEKAARKAAKKAEPAPLYLPEFISVGNLADVIGVKPAQFVARMEEMGFEEITYKDILDAETAGLVAAEYNFEAIFDIGENDLKAAPEPEDPSSLPSRPPVVTIMGHVDHGKTTILDWLRKSSVAATEHGGITQHIGAFSVNMPAGKAITFLDTPGHSAFLEMRRRGADVTDIVVLVVAADDSVKPQTIEAIKHANSAKVPVIVAISKIDKEGKNPDKVKADLSAQGVHVEDYGGDVQAIGVSGKTGEGMVELEEAIMALSEMLDHRADTACNVEGWVIEASTKSYGRVASALIRRGTLRPGDIIVAGTAWARVRTLRNEAGVTIHEATPGMPVEIDGWREQPGAGTEILQAPDEQKAKEVVEYRLERTDTEKMGIDMVAINEARREITETRRREKEDEDETRRRLESESTGPKPVNFILKADVDGSAEAVMNSVSAIGNNEVFANIIRSGVGPVSEFDIEHAATAGGRIISFNQPIDPNMMRMAEAERVEIMDHNIIYKLTDEVKSILSDLLPPSVTIRVTGEAEIREVFSITIKGREKMLIAGSRVRNGMINKARKVKVLRGEEVVYDGKHRTHIQTPVETYLTVMTGAITSLKNVKKDVTEMRKDTECGIGFEGWTDFAVGDRIQCYDEIFEKRYL
ncbi:Mitochondrial translation initiation factor [Penicillium brevicompactum]|uniref:Translation initiation factor IF-2, mitochondrial n=1 Tax=Penicillium brevicompactum TaxID=5074 RepID=A0A9W9RVU7_PENBR|nr:Mitochondrial translation initiation factor [Penicillium brevicompactum]